MPPPPPNPPQLLHSGHPCNPQVDNGIYLIKVDDNGNYSAMADPRRAIPNPNRPGCWMLAPVGGRYKRRNRKVTKKARRNRRISRRR